MPFTDRQVKNFKAKAKRYDVTETGVSSDRRGLMIRVHPSGAKTWRFRYRMHKQTEVITLGGYPTISLQEAREEIDRCRKVIRKGISPRYQKKLDVHREVGADTIQALYEAFRDNQLREKRARPEQAEQALEKHFLPKFGELKVKDVTRKLLYDHIESIANQGKKPRYAEVVKALVVQMFSYAANKGIIEASPAVGLGTIGSRGDPCSRVLDSDEIKKLWKNVDYCNMRSNMPAAFKLMLLTGQRPGAVAAARWDQIEDDLWSIPPEHRQKKKRDADELGPHVVPLSKLALEVLGKRPREGGWLFPSHIKGKDHVDRHALSRALRNKADILDVAHFTPRDLRRTTKTNLSRLRIDSRVSERILDHEIAGVEAHYDWHDYIDEMREALKLWGEDVRNLLDGKQPTVTMIRKAA